MSRSTSSLALTLGLTLVAALVSPGLARAEPHPHHGTLTPFSATPPSPTLTAADLSVLAAGNVVRKQADDKGADGAEGGRGMVIQDIAAPPEVVWGRILDFEDYPRMVDDVESLEVYERRPGRIKARFVLESAGLELEYFVDHTVNEKAHYITWTLDYAKKSELDDVVGYWYAQPHPSKPGWTRLYYSVDVRVKGWVPGFVEELVREQGLKKATRWVKREAEAEMRKRAAPKTR